MGSGELWAPPFGLEMFAKACWPEIASSENLAQKIPNSKLVTIDGAAHTP